MSEPLKTVTCIVDRRVLVELLKWAVSEDPVPPEDYYLLTRFREEVEAGTRCELYAKDWPGSGDPT